MSTTIKFIIFDCRDTAKQIQLDIKPGTTIPQLAEQCVEVPGVTATAKQIITKNCLVDGIYKPPSYVFSGEERQVVFVEMIAGG